MPSATPVFTLPGEEMIRLQTERLCRTVAYAAERIPFYRDALAAHGVRPEDVRSLDNLPSLPFTWKKDIGDHYPYGLLAVPPTAPVRLHASSGTTGKPINVFYTRNDLTHWIECIARELRIAGVGAEDVCQIAFRYTLFTGAFGHHRGAEHIGAMVLPISSGQTERQLLMMRDLKTTVLHCTPSYAVVIAEKVAELGLDPAELSLRLGIHGAEPMSDEMRDEIQRALGLRVARDYGLTELGGPGVSIECPEQAGYHINEDHFYPEIVDPETGVPLPDGELGELVFTSLTKEACPLLRYRTRDLTVLDRTPCACGNTLVRHGKIVWRTDDMLIIGGVNFFPSQVESLLLAFPEVAPHYGIHLHREGRRDRVRIEAEAAPEFWARATPEDRGAVQAKLADKARNALGFRVAVELLAPATLARSEGKTQRVHDLRQGS